MTADPRSADPAGRTNLAGGAGSACGIRIMIQKELPFPGALFASVSAVSDPAGLIRQPDQVA